VIQRNPGLYRDKGEISREADYQFIGGGGKRELAIPRGKRVAAEKTGGPDRTTTKPDWGEKRNILLGKKIGKTRAEEDRKFRSTVAYIGRRGSYQSNHESRGEQLTV